MQQRSTWPERLKIFTPIFHKKFPSSWLWWLGLLFITWYDTVPCSECVLIKCILLCWFQSKANNLNICRLKEQTNKKSHFFKIRLPKSNTTHFFPHSMGKTQWPHLDEGWWMQSLVGPLGVLLTLGRGHKHLGSTQPSPHLCNGKQKAWLLSNDFQLTTHQISLHSSTPLKPPVQIF